MAARTAIFAKSDREIPIAPNYRSAGRLLNSAILGASCSPSTVDDGKISQSDHGGNGEAHSMVNQGLRPRSFAPGAQKAARL
jgi:hypothetical protein